MTIYNRPEEKVFASGAKPGEVVAFPDILRGWGLTLEQTEGKPPMEWMNAAFERIDEAIRYFMQRGLSEWSASEDYPSGAFVQHGGKAYRALQVNSNVTPGTAAATWAEVTPNASSSIRGMVELATNAETQAGDSASLAVTPAGLHSRTATTTRTGLIEIATESQAKALQSALLAITPATLGAVLAELPQGVPAATFAEIAALTADEGPLICADNHDILYLWDAVAESYKPVSATEQKPGTVQLATAEQARDLAASGVVMTPETTGYALQPHIAGSAAFTRLTNEIQMDGIVPRIGLEIGDVIEITSSADNNRLHTVESITDDDTIIVNYEHRDGAGSLSLVDETANVAIRRIAKWYAAPLGLGQAWVDLKSSRANDVAYQNTTGRGIQLSIYLDGSNVVANVSPDGTNWLLSGRAGSGLGNMQNNLIPDGWYYKIQLRSEGWPCLELR